MITIFNKFYYKGTEFDLKQISNQGYALVKIPEPDLSYLKKFCKQSAISQPDEGCLTYNKDLLTYYGVYTNDAWYSIEEVDNLIDELSILKFIYRCENEKL